MITSNSSSKLILLPMRDFASCFSEHAVKVADYACSGSSSTTTTTSSSNCLIDPSVQTAVTSIYVSKLTSGKQIFIKVTWSQSNISPAVSISINDETHPLRKKRGSRSFISGNMVVGIHWDISIAKYGSGPEPLKDFYVVVFADAEFALLLGDMCKEYVRKFGESASIAAFSMVRRTEQVVGQSLFTSKIQFRNDGMDHEILVSCKGDGGREVCEPELLMLIDGKRVVHVRGVKLKFRGNQTVFVEDLPLDIMWDLHDWFFCIPSGSATFMFRLRSSLESRLWLEEELLERESGNSGFCLLMQAFRRL